MVTQHATTTERAWTITHEQLKTGQGIICPTTGEAFRPLSYQLQQAGSHTFAWIWCCLCDTHRRGRADPAFDPLRMQTHGYLIVDDAETATEGAPL